MRVEFEADDLKSSGLSAIWNLIEASNLILFQNPGVPQRRVFLFVEGHGGSCTSF